jgi:NitT/TauT family transport system substrate-binding protein
VALALTLVTLAAACGDDGTAGDRVGNGTARRADGASAADQPTGTLRLGYFPSITHAVPLVGVDRGLFAEALGAGVDLETQTFDAGPAAVEALLSGSLDAAFLGPNPAVNAFAVSDGAAVRIVSGAAAGGAFLVVREGITTAADLAGTRLATPQLGNTQDVALRTWLAGRGHETTKEGGGDVSIVPQPNARTLQTFLSGDVDGAWVPEPWATQLIEEGGGHVLVDEATLWPDGEYVTTHLLVRTDYLDEHRDVVAALVDGVVDTTDYLEDHPLEARAIANDAIDALTHEPLPEPVIEAAWRHLTFTYDPIAASLQTSADHATALDLLEPVDLAGIYDLGPLHAALAAAGRDPVDDAGLGAAT